MPSLTDWAALSKQASQDRRKGKRLSLNFPVEVSGFDRTGRMFCERTTTLDISEAGCRFQLQTPLEREDVVAIKLLSPRSNRHAAKPTLFRIIWVAREAEGWAVGALKLQQDNPWHVTFPPSNPKKDSST